MALKITYLTLVFLALIGLESQAQTPNPPCSLTLSGFTITAIGYSTTLCPGSAPVVNFVAKPEISILGHLTLACINELEASAPGRIELSDATGSFGTPITLAQFNTLSATSQALNSGAFVFPLTLPPGNNYKIRVFISHNNGDVYSNAAGPFTVLPLPKVTGLVVDDSSCPVKIQGNLTGTSFVLSSDNGYVFSYVFRENGAHVVSFQASQPGSYRLQVVVPNQTCLSLSDPIQLSQRCP